MTRQRILGSQTGTVNAPSDRFNHTAAWTDNGMVVLGGAYGYHIPDSGGILCVTEISMDLAVTKTHTGNFVTGGQGTYDITVENVGAASTVEPILLEDTLPLGFNFLSGSGTNWACANSGQLVSCSREVELPPIGNILADPGSFTFVRGANSAVNSVTVYHRWRCESG